MKRISGKITAMQFDCHQMLVLLIAVNRYREHLTRELVKAPSEMTSFYSYVSSHVIDKLCKQISEDTPVPIFQPINSPLSIDEHQRLEKEQGIQLAQYLGASVPTAVLYEMVQKLLEEGSWVSTSYKTNYKQEWESQSQEENE